MCPGGSFGAVFDAVSSPVQGALHRFAKIHLDWLEGIVREGVERGQLQIGDQRPRDVAMQIVAGVQGALLMGRLTGDPHVIDMVAAELRSYFGLRHAHTETLSLIEVLWRDHRLGREQVQDCTRSLTPRSNQAEAQEIERRADQVIGVHVRRLAYAETLPSHSHLVKPSLFLRASGWHRLIGNMMWPVARRIMIRIHDIRPGSASESRSRLDCELDWLDDKLADGRSYLAGERFSRVDLTVASLLAEFAMPKEMPVHHEMLKHDALAADVERWSKRPVMRWVIAQYRAHRTPASSLEVAV